MDIINMGKNEFPVITLVLKPTPSLNFFRDMGIEVGRLYWGKGKLEFEGEAEESAKIFIKFLKEHWNKYKIVT